MGVSLERVQNKFACIIGELSSEPFVLSQFAIWVDLRIAEYKSKGSISLDCTGSVPEPSWLKGLHPPPSRDQRVNMAVPAVLSTSRNARHKRHLLSGAQNASPVFHQSPTSAINERLLPSSLEDDGDIVVVKEEPADVDQSNIFPVSLHTHDGSTPDGTANSRKRLAMEERDLLHSDNSIFQSPPKVRRVSSASDNSMSAVGQDSASNQSFMSVIGLADQQSASALGDSVNTDVDLSVTLQEIEKREFHRGDNSSDIVYDPSMMQPSTSAGSSHSVPGGPRLILGSSYAFPTGLSRSLSPPSMNPLVVANQRGPQTPETSASSDMNSRFIVIVFERWLQDAPYHDFRKIEEIPPDELDEILAKFWLTIKTRTGTDYQRMSMYSLRTSLERHLKKHNYPFSTVKSARFLNSQQAFKERIQQLKIAEEGGVS